MARSENLTIMFVDMVGFTERTAQQSRAQNEALLHGFHRLLLPVISGFGGRLIKSIGDALLVVFQSPTDGVRCGMGLHDAVAEYNQTAAPVDRFHIRVAINVGEVRVEYGDIFGEAVNVAARLEAITPEDQLYLTEAVYLAMNKAEVPAESLGQHSLKGIPEPVRLFRVPPRQVNRLVPQGEDLSARPWELPYGGVHRTGSSRNLRVMLRHLRNRVRTMEWRGPVRQRPGAALAAALSIFLGLPLAWWYAATPVPPVAAEAAIEEPPPPPPGPTEEERRLAELLIEQGHQAWTEGRRRDALGMYAEAMRLVEDWAKDERIAARLVVSLGRSSDLASPIILRYPTTPIVEQLVKRTTSAGPIGRRRAVELLEVLGKSQLIDRTAVALANLRDTEQCDQRLQYVRELRSLKDPRALPALRSTLEGGLRGWLQNACLRDEAQVAINELQRIQRTAAKDALPTTERR